MKRILAITGTRADYGIYRPVFRAIRASKKLSLGLIVIGMHLKKEFGRTVEDIRKDGFSITAELDTLTLEDTPQAMAEFVGRTLIECVRVFAKERPDVILLLGDRGEQLAAAIAAAELGIPIAHLHGGELSGTIDDAMRHAITQMASVHFATAPVHAKNIRAMKGPCARDIYVTGAPALDTINALKPIPKEQLCKRIGFDPVLPILLFAQHPDTLEKLPVEKQIAPSLKAVESWKGSILFLGANADAGGMRINATIEAFVTHGRNRKYMRSLSHDDFLSWEACADVLVGNSSSGIIEAASFHLPVVNVGDRQKGRLRSGNVIDVSYDAEMIAKAIQRAMRPAFRRKVRSCKNAYDMGGAAQKIVKIFEWMA